MAGPLGDKDLVDIQLRLDQLVVADEEIKKAERAGLDVESLKETARTQRSQLLRIKQTYFPGE